MKVFPIINSFIKGYPFIKGGGDLEENDPFQKGKCVAPCRKSYRGSILFNKCFENRYIIYF